MGNAAQQETMLRKPILMPPSMIEKVDAIARSRKVSFARIVREAINSFDGESSKNDEEILDALADTMIETTHEIVKKIEMIENRLDDTHATFGAR